MQYQILSIMVENSIEQPNRCFGTQSATLPQLLLSRSQFVQTQLVSSAYLSLMTVDCVELPMPNSSTILPYEPRWPALLSTALKMSTRCLMESGFCLAAVIFCVKRCLHLGDQPTFLLCHILRYLFRAIQ